MIPNTICDQFLFTKDTLKAIKKKHKKLNWFILGTISKNVWIIFSFFNWGKAFGKAFLIENFFFKSRHRFFIQIKIWHVYNDFVLISFFLNDHVIDISGAPSKVRYVVIFLQIFMKSTAQSLRKRLCTLRRDWFTCIKQNHY